MVQNGTVKQIENGKAEVLIARSSACGENCASCGLCNEKMTSVWAINEAGAEKGSRVTVDMSDSKILGAAFLVYIVPLIALIAGYFAGNAIFGDETAAIGTGFAAMAVFFAVIILCDRKLKKRYTPRIVSIISND